MTAIRSSVRASDAGIHAVPTRRRADASASARAPIKRLAAESNTTTMLPLRPRAGESSTAGPRDRDAIHDRMAVAGSARRWLWHWLHPVTGTPLAGCAVHVDPVPGALHAEPSGEAYVHGRGSAVCVRVDELVAAGIAH